jgi:hypothetical protein
MIPRLELLFEKLNFSYTDCRNTLVMAVKIRRMEHAVNRREARFMLAKQRKEEAHV